METKIYNILFTEILRVDGKKKGKINREGRTEKKTSPFLKGSIVSLDIL